MDSDSEIVEDSEPERVATGHPAFQADSPEPPSLPGSPTLAPRAVPDPAPVASTSRYFAKPPAASEASTSTSAVPRRREVPWANLHAPSPPPLSRKVSLPTTSAAPDEQPSPPKKPRKSTSDDDQPVKERKKKKKGRASQFQPASVLLKANPALAVDCFDPVEDEKKPRKVNRTTKARSSGESVENLDDSLEDSLDEPAPPKIDSSVFQRVALGLPPLVPRPDNLVDDLGDDGDASDDGSAASKLRTGLNQFKYTVSGYSGGTVSLPSIPIASISRSVPSPPPPPLETPPLDHIKLLEACAVCELAWTTTKTPKAKETHLRKCATAAEYTAETLLILTENVILARARSSELERRERDAGRSLFERTIGTGEGKGAREVTVVGVERAGGGHIDQYDPARIEAAQAEIDAAKKRTPVDALTKVAGKIKDRRRVLAEEKARRAKGGVKAENDDDGDALLLPTPRPTGVLRVDSAEARAHVVAKAHAVLDGLAGTGLTQAPDVALLPSLMDVDGPPSTQPFEPSRLATKLAAAGEIEVVSLPMKERQAVAGPSGAIKSLWRAADGSDDATIRRVVSISSLSSSSPSPACRSSGPFESPTQRSPSTSSTLDPSLTAQMSGMGMEYGNEVWEDEWAGQDDGLLVWDGERMEEDDYEQPPTTITTPAVPPLPASTTKPKHSLTTRPKPKPRPLAKGKAKARVDDSDSPGFVFPDSDGALDSDASASPAPVPSTSRPPGMPDYISYTLAKLQSEVSQYGFRVSKERSVLVDQLMQVWIAMHPVPPPPATPANKPRAKARSKKLVPNSSDNDQDAEEPVGERLRKLIAANEELYLKVLRYEPIFFDEIVSLAAANGIKSSKPLLMRCLDEQCITFYTQDPTNGSRKRYK